MRQLAVGRFASTSLTAHRRTHRGPGCPAEVQAATATAGLRLHWYSQTGSRDPYRSVAALIHTLAIRP